MATEPDITHVAYGDESSHTSGPFGAVAVVSMPAAIGPRFSAELAQLLDESSVTELKWQKLKGARDRFAALKVLDAFFLRADRGEVRANVLVWDFNDSRHAVKGRDDHANLGRLYYHLCSSVFRHHWPHGAVWGLYPDEQDAVRWAELEQVLQRTGFRSGLEAGGLFRAQSEGFRVAEVRPRPSVEEPLVQLADLLAGLAIYSRTSFDTFAAWRKDQDDQIQLFRPETETVVVSSKDAERCRVLHALDTAAKTRKWGVGLRSTRGLQTREWRRGMLSFWLWEPQHPLDKAPTTASRGRR